MLYLKQANKSDIQKEYDVITNLLKMKMVLQMNTQIARLKNFKIKYYHPISTQQKA